MEQREHQRCHHHDRPRAALFQRPEQNPPEHDLLGGGGDQHRGEDGDQSRRGGLQPGERAGHLLGGVALGEQQRAERQEQHGKRQLEHETDTDVCGVPGFDGEAESRVVLSPPKQPEHEQVAGVLPHHRQHEHDLAFAEERAEGDRRRCSDEATEDDIEEVEERPGPGHWEAAYRGRSHPLLRWSERSTEVDRKWKSTSGSASRGDRPTASTT